MNPGEMDDGDCVDVMTAAWRLVSRFYRVGLPAAWLACMFLGHTAIAQDYPSRPIRLLIHTPAGSLVDVLGRLAGQDLGQRLGQSVIAENRPGAATMIAVEQLT